MRGELLRQGKLEEFQALGVDGNQVYVSATQLRNVLARKAGADVADVLAIPVRNDQGNTFDWYSTHPGEVVAWSAATVEQQSKGREKIAAFQQAVADLADTYSASGAGSDQKLFGSLLNHALRYPGSDHVYLVDGQPVITFWGFSLHGAGVEEHVSLPPQTALPVTPVAEEEPAVRDKRVWWLRLPWWLLLLLLIPLLLLFLWWLLSLLGGLPWGLPSMPGFERPALSAPNLSPPEIEVPTLTMPEVPSAPALPGLPDLAAGGSGAAGNSEAGLPAESVPPAVETPAPAPAPVSESAPEPMPTPLPANGASEPKGESNLPLQIPDGAVQSGDLSFLDGRWRSITSLIDSQTGKPTEVIYDFKNGQGTATIHRSNGDVCQGPASATIDQANLNIAQNGALVCSDGQKFAPSTTNCSLNEQKDGVCQGQYPNGESFTVEIVR
ncbi:SrfA family protein [Terasakiella pusilla]|uniref:SrfA family protein n=1 Tax=Terasakiella pusilla TaxID=64973 RepID=UPI003AA95C34